jgi:hypothetical protein
MRFIQKQEFTVFFGSNTGLCILSLNPLAVSMQFDSDQTPDYSGITLQYPEMKQNYNG